MSRTETQLLNPNFASDVAQTIAALPIAKLIGIEVIRLAPGEADLELAFREDLCFRGAFLGGIIGALADFAGGYAAATLLAPGAVNMTADYTVKLLAPARGEKLIARGRVLQAGKTISVAKTDVFAIRGESPSLCATALVTMRNVSNDPSRQA
ncbi:MAG: hypothetical protein A2W18_06195 [Candidatus Muproteobacteria bacterium RBG_16_60_9]|uniref:Thioesterase domain-containing protein n=1 Tax=Candidatus Muproteobacteria bacterium RBG_16_60_9 TaxID=1817755 RepID=A0A1F6VHM8_9PROT|nr:MAG: hypothetical protein A2W18_06195 [Candidatus Muproteobacteria bacterium RBG_16_60_9]